MESLNDIYINRIGTLTLFVSFCAKLERWREERKGGAGFDSGFVEEAKDEWWRGLPTPHLYDIS